MRDGSSPGISSMSILMGLVISASVSLSWQSLGFSTHTLMASRPWASSDRIVITTSLHTHTAGDPHKLYEQNSRAIFRAFVCRIHSVQMIRTLKA